MKNKISKVVALGLVLIMILTGCSSESTIKINSKGSAAISAKMLIERDKIDSIAKAYGQTDVLKCMQTIVKSSTETAGNAKLVTVNGVQYYEITMAITQSKKDLNSDGENYITEDTFYTKIAQDVMMDKETLAYYKTIGINTTELENMIMKVTIELPSNITNTNGTINQSNKKQATFNIKIGKATTLFATSKKGRTIASTKALLKKINNLKKPKIKSVKVKSIKKKRATVKIKMKKMKGVTYHVTYTTYLANNNNYYSTKTVKRKKNTFTINKLKVGNKYEIEIYASKNNKLGTLVESKTVKKTIKISKKLKK